MNDQIGGTKQSLTQAIGELEKVAGELFTKVSGSASPNDQLKAENVLTTQGIVGISIRRIKDVIETLHLINEKLEF